ncbi:rod shape-determining protein MreC [Lutibacter sp.]|uniref:rod shape-determining protein MreC n=1 Tax=Lutibacter sp. TaxID=1925666 RepID=UPI001A361A8E|nr:rod shape-determining protein MreC [Lutibacter sp.]MBI9041910.1 rod shape-determining protein MreC [Lutibacter sp.]
MQHLIYFIRKYRYFLLFILLEILAFYLTIQHHSYHQSKFVNSANFVTGGLYNKVSSINEYFHLKTENQLLNEENARLKNQLDRVQIISNDSVYNVLDTTYNIQKYEYLVAKIINNNYSKRNNYLTINKGSDTNISPELGVINSKGVIGVVKNVSSNFATVLSILNSNSKINVRLKNSSHFGSLIWNGDDYAFVQIIDFPRQAKLKKGDTIITGGKSAIFPEGISIGTIENIIIKNHQYHQIDVKLFNDMSSIGQVQIIKNLQKEEQKALEEKSNNE